MSLTMSWWDWKTWSKWDRKCSHFSASVLHQVLSNFLMEEFVGFCFKQLRVAFQSELFCNVSEEIQELKLAFLNCFKEARFLNECLSERRVRYQRNLARRFLAISSRTWVGIWKKFWAFHYFLIVEFQAAVGIIFVTFWTAFSSSFEHFSWVFRLMSCSIILRNLFQSVIPSVRQAWQSRRGGWASRDRRTEV